MLDALPPLPILEKQFHRIVPLTTYLLVDDDNGLTPRMLLAKILHDVGQMMNTRTVDRREKTMEHILLTGTFPSGGK